MVRGWRAVVAGLTAVSALGGSMGRLGAAGDGEGSVVLENDFETSSEPWWPLGSPTVSLTNAEAHEGAGSLSVSDRTAPWEGIGMDSTGVLRSGSAYEVSAWVKLPAGADESAVIRLSVEEFPADVSRSITVDIGTATATSADWVEVSGVYALMEGVASVNVSISADADADADDGNPSFLVDDILVVTAPAPPMPPVPPGIAPGGAIRPVVAPVSLATGSGNVAALTFDDGPSPDNTPAVLDFLAEHDIRAVFCVIGEQVQAPGGAEVLRSIVAGGHVLCSHSTGSQDMGSWTPSQVQTDLIATLQIIRDALGDPHAEVPFWRAPNGSWGATRGVAVSLGMQPLAVVNGIDDWATQDVEVLTTNLRAAILPGELVLLHDGGGDRSGTIAALRAVVSERLADGWSFSLPLRTPPVD